MDVRLMQQIVVNSGSEVVIASLLNSSPSLFHLIFIQPLRSRSIVTREQETFTRTQAANRREGFKNFVLHSNDMICGT